MGWKEKKLPQQHGWLGQIATENSVMLLSTQELQDPTDLKYVSNIGRVPSYLKNAAKAHCKLTPEPKHLVDSIKEHQLDRLWQEFKTPLPSPPRRRKRFPLPWHPVLGMF